MILESLKNLVKSILNYLDVGEPKLNYGSGAAGLLYQLRDRFVESWNMSPDDAKKAVAALMYGEAQARGQDPGAMYNDLPKPVQDFLEYTPADLKKQQNFTLAGLVVTIGSILGAGVAAVLGAPVVVVGGLAGLAMLSQVVVNNINDVFHWGPLMSYNNAQDIKTAAERAKSVGVTQYGDFTTGDIATLAEAYQKATISGLVDPITKIYYETTTGGISDALTVLIGRLNIAGVAPTQQDVILLLKGWALPPTDRSDPEGIKTLIASQKVTALAAGEVRVTTRITTKPKLFLGTIIAGRVAPLSIFTRARDDEITDDADLLTDARTNLARWLENFPSRLSFEVQLKNNPIDEGGVKVPGTWAVLVLSFSSILGKRMTLDEVLLGPLDPIRYYPETQRVLDIAASLPDFARYAKLTEGEITKLMTAPGVFVPEAGLSTKVVEAALKAPEVAPVTPTPPAVVIPPPPVEKGPPTPEELEAYPPEEIFKPVPAAPKIPAEGNLPKSIMARTVTVNVDALFVRSGPSTEYPLAGTMRLVRGNTFTAVGFTHGENVGGEDRWWKSQVGNWVWCGGTMEKPD